MNKETYISEIPVKDKSKKGLSLLIKDNSIQSKMIKNGAITMNKLSKAILDILYKNIAIENPLSYILNSNGKIKTELLPGYIDDVVELTHKYKISNIENSESIPYIIQQSISSLRYTDDITYNSSDEIEISRELSLIYNNPLHVFYLTVKVTLQNNAEVNRKILNTYFSWDDNIAYLSSDVYGDIIPFELSNDNVTIKEAITASPLIVYSLSNGFKGIDAEGIMGDYIYESGKIYMDINTNKSYRWTGSQLIEIQGGGITLGNTSDTAFRGDLGYEIYNNIITGNPPLVNPKITIEWTFYPNVGDVSVIPQNIGTSSDPIIEVGYQAAYKASFKWTAKDGYKSPAPTFDESTEDPNDYDSTGTSGDFGTTLPDNGKDSTIITGQHIRTDLVLTQNLYAPNTGLIIINNAVSKSKGKQTTTASVSITFLYRMYYGITQYSDITGDVITQLQNNILQNDKTFTITDVTAKEGEYYIIAYPVVQGALTSISQDKTIPALKSFTRTEVNVTNNAGYIQKYYVYRTNITKAFTGATLDLTI